LSSTETRNDIERGKKEGLYILEKKSRMIVVLGVLMVPKDEVGVGVGFDKSERYDSHSQG
jgi:hypothetical protein